MEKYNSLESSFVAIYGRRRIGKTYLINELFNESIIFRYAGIYNGKKNEQLYAFSESLKEYGLKPEEDLNDWFKAFSCLKELIKNSSQKKKVIFLDEIAWMYTKGSSPSIL
ncbi:MAG: ATP-binding protein [Acholeplasmatales bacterium]|nr:ATP-binding protein [Acholeplasmatales bacterium]